MLKKKTSPHSHGHTGSLVYIIDRYISPSVSSTNYSKLTCVMARRRR
jgi:hypothetical protein